MNILLALVCLVLLLICVEPLEILKPWCPYLVNNGKHRFVARVSYDGTNFHGFQEQEPSVRTVQGTISSKLSQRFSRKIKITGASRTDIGVHAMGQVVHFDLESDLVSDLKNFMFNFNRMLPSDIRIYNLSHAPIGTLDQESMNDIFHATKSAVGKLYSYRFCTNQFVSPLKRKYYAHFYRPLDLGKFESGLKIFQGTHDFTAFGNRLERIAKDLEKSGWHKELSPIRTIHSANLFDEGDGYYRVEFVLTSALYRMVRNIVGSCAHVAMSMMDMDTMVSLLHDKKSRSENFAKSAEPHGLCLEKVIYDHY